MTEARGRFQVTVLDNVVYAIGGSNGSCEFFIRVAFTVLRIQMENCDKFK